MVHGHIPLVDLKANYLGIKEEVDAAIADTINNTQFILGPKVTNFEANFAKYIGTKHCLGCASGSDAIILALRALEVGPGDEVITQSNTFIATVLGISAVGATPVLVDCDPNTYMIDIEQVEKAITPKTKVIMPVNLYGFSADFDRLVEIAKKNNLYLVEDCAQSHGAYWKDQKTGTFGDLSCFSFYPGKNLGAFGDGGAVCTNNTKFYEDLKFKRNWGSVVKYYHDTKGFNSRLDGIQAAVLDIKLKHLDRWNQRRREIAELYNQQLTNVGDLVLPQVPEHVTPVWHIYAVKTSKRDALLKFLNDSNIGAAIHYPIPIHKTKAYEELAHLQLPNCETNGPLLVSLPIYPELTDEMVLHIVAKVKEFFTN